MSFDPITGAYLARCARGHEIRVSPEMMALRRRSEPFPCPKCVVEDRAEADQARRERLLETDGVATSAFE
jgi:hypothetical protein